MSPPTSPLKARDINTSAPSPPTKLSSKAAATTTTPAAAAAAANASEKKPDTQQKPKKSMEYHRQILQSRLEEHELTGARGRGSRNKHTYVSPSDMIMSPATQKLEALKGKRFGKAKGQSLFANTMSKNAAAGKNGDGGAVESMGGGVDGEKQ
ncbi:MAG: hypothetical protein Q9185_001715 [Variospora sp. 1 TL-2023]